MSYFPLSTFDLGIKSQRSESKMKSEATLGRHVISARLCVEYANTQLTGNYTSDDGKSKVNQDSRVSLKSLFEETLSREDLPVY